MTEERDSQLSAMFDGELPGGECELLARRLTRDDGVRVQELSQEEFTALLAFRTGLRRYLRWSEAAVRRCGRRG